MITPVVNFGASTMQSNATRNTTRLKGRRHVGCIFNKCIFNITAQFIINIMITTIRVVTRNPLQMSFINIGWQGGKLKKDKEKWGIDTLSIRTMPLTHPQRDIRTMLSRILLDFNMEGIVIKNLLLLLTLCAALNIRIHSSMTA